MRCAWSTGSNLDKNYGNTPDSGGFLECFVLGTLHNIRVGGSEVDASGTEVDASSSELEATGTAVRAMSRVS